MGHGALSWMLLTAMEIPRPAWPPFLAQTGGTFPADAGGFHNLMLAIRRQGHIAEQPTLDRPLSTRATDDQAERGTTFGTEIIWARRALALLSLVATLLLQSPLIMTDNGSMVDRRTRTDWSGAGWNGGYEAQPEYYLDDGGFSVCSTCSQYWYDDHDDYNDTGTEDECDESMFSPEELASYYGSFEGCTEQSLRQDYMFAKSRFRRFTNQRSRGSCFPGRPQSWDLRYGGGGKGKRGKGKGKYFAGFPFGPSSLAGGKCKSKGKGKGNPIGADGQQIK